jgi:hypothetical protein
VKAGMRHEATDNSKKPKVIGFAALTHFAMLFALCGSTDAQNPAKIPRIGVMVTGERGLELLRQGLHERGYVEGKNIAIVHRYIEGNTDRMPSLVAEILQNKVDV